MESAGLSEYEFIATLDNRTSQRCRSLDGTIHLLEEYDPGTNAPPMHPRCRSTISAVINEGTRTAKVKGRNIRVPAEMKYNDFKAVYVDKAKIRQEKRHEQANTTDIKFDMQRFGLQKLPEGNYNCTIRRQVQNRHIEGTGEHKDYAARIAQQGYKPSLLAKGVNAAELVKEFHKKGIYDPNPKDNSPREIVNAGRIIGQYWDINKGEYVETTFIEIVYSKHGAHVYPIFYLEEWLK